MRRSKNKNNNFTNACQLQRVKFFAPESKRKTFRHFGNFTRSARHLYTQIPTVINKNSLEYSTHVHTLNKWYYYLYRLPVSASFELQTSRPGKCVPESTTGTSLEWLRSASAVCITLWFVHSRSSWQTTPRECWLGLEIACDVPVSCRSLRTNPEIDAKLY